MPGLFHDMVHIHAFGRAWQVTIIDPDERALQRGDQADVVTAPMPGTVVEVTTRAGASIAEGETVVIIESMKMQTPLTATRDGVVEKIHFQNGESFDRGAALVSLVSEETGEA